MEVLIVIVVAVLAGLWLWRKRSASVERRPSKFDLAAERAAQRRGEAVKPNAGKIETPSEPGPARAKVYPVAIVGEKSYQQAIKALDLGDKVELYHEADNPYDDEAVAVVARGKTIGYLARGDWLREALLHEGKSYTASIGRLSRGGKHVGVTLEVMLAGRPLGSRSYRS